MLFYIDWFYIVLVLPAILLTLIANSFVKANFKRYSQVDTNGLTGAKAARIVLDENGLTDVEIEHFAGELTDHFDPKENVVRLSDSTYNSASCAAVGIACHEVGHAIQYANNYTPLKIRNAIIPVTNFGSRLSTPLIILGIILSIFGAKFAIIAYIGVALFGLTVLFQLITLPVEFNASRRAMQTINQFELLDAEGKTGARKVLISAALTYVGALAVSVSQLLYLFLVVAKNTRRRN